MTKKKIISLLLVMALLVCAACTAQTATTGAPAEATPATAETAETVSEPDDSTVIAEIGDTQTVTYGELKEYYEYYAEMITYYGSEVPTDDAEVEELQDGLLDDLVNQAKLLYYAEQYGLTTLTEEEQAQVDSEVSEEMDSYMESFREQAEEEGAADVEARARELFDEDLLAYGIDMDSYEYEAYLVQLYSEDLYLEKLENYIRDAAVATEEDAQAYYDQLVTDQSADYAETPSLYADDAEYYEKYGGTPCAVIPEGYVRIKAIAILPEGEIDSSYTEKTTQMSEYEAEYGKLALEDETVNAKRLKDIKTLYAALKLETETMHESYMATAREKAEKAYAALTAGTAFDAVLAEYGEDADYTNYPSLMLTGRPLYLLGTDSNEAELREAAATLKPGEYSGIVETDSALYIIYLVKEETAGTVPFADVYDACLACAATEKGDTAWDEQQTAWDEDDSMVTTYPERYRSLGKTAG